MRTHRMVRKISGESDWVGQVFVETPGVGEPGGRGGQLGRERWEAWMADHSRPCPMPLQHRMFRFPAEYACEPYTEMVQLTLTPERRHVDPEAARYRLNQLNPAPFADDGDGIATEVS